jgi:two-component system KDP operon response regulator KdpE
MRVLVIEDDAFLRRAYEVGLRGQGFEVHAAADGEIGIGMAEANPPDAILLDILMPALSGVQVLERLKGNPDLVRVPIVVLSNVCTADEAQAMLAMGASAYLSKTDARIADIGHTIRELCSGGG